MIWEELIKVGLIGTDRSELSEATLRVLKDLGIDTKGTPAKVLLEGATFYAHIRRSGFEPQSWEGALPDICPKDETQICNKKSSDHLTLILNGMYENALDEFFRYLIHFKKTLPPERLPELLEKCRSDQELWQRLRFAIGERGHWLIQQNPEWQFLVGKTETQHWDVSTQSERIGILKHLRKVDPLEAIEKIQSTWEEDTWQLRKAFLQQLEVNLSLTDEDFLEKCLDDRRKDIRKEAARLLAMLEGSALSKRMLERIQNCITIKSGNKEKLEIELPDTCDKSMTRDGIDPRKKWSKGGLKASYFAQMFVTIPPKHWIDFFEKKADAILPMFVRSEWSELLVQAVIDATVRWKDSDWMTALLDFYFKNHEKKRWDNLDVKALFGVVPTDLFNQLASKELDDLERPLDADDPVSMLLEINENPWDKKLTLLFMQHLKKIIRQNIAYSWQYVHYRHILDRAGYATNPNLYDTLQKSWSNDEYYWTGWGKELDNFLQILKFRRAMILALNAT